MSDVDVRKITEAAGAVIAALEPLSIEERARVLESAAALYGISAMPQRARRAEQQPDEDHDKSGGDSDMDENSKARSAKRLSIVEFLHQKAPATNAQRIACFAYYREHVESQPRFARGDLEPLFSAAKLAKPANYDRDFSAAAREGWIHEDGAASYLTQNGERTVEQGFAGKAKPRGSTVVRKNKSPKTH